MKYEPNVQHVNICQGEFQIFGKMVEYRIVVEYSLHPSLLELCEIVCYLRKWKLWICCH
ncbi:unnamed protein product [Larinioides sclopetarius]